MKDKIAEKLLLFIAFSAILSLLLITFFIFQQDQQGAILAFYR
jgi:hypothetical protein